MRSVAAFAAVAVVLSLSLHMSYDDPDGGDDPGYQISGQQPGLQEFPPVCGVQPLACALRRDPGHGVWLRPAPEPEH